jgi:hypothetical protein
MQSLPTDTVPAADFILRHMYRPLDLAEGRFFAVPETANPIGGDVWFWSDDNAKILEFLSRPELWRRFPGQTGEILRFVQAMCRGPFIFRRVSPPRLDEIQREGTVAAFRHALMNIRFDLARGSVLAGLRFHDERIYDNVLLTANRVEFTFKNRRFSVPVEKQIDKAEATRHDNTLRLRYSTELVFKPRWREMRLGTISYSYIFRAGSMLIEAEAALEIDAGVQVSDVVLTIGHDQLGQFLYTTVAADTPASAAPLFSAGQPGRRLLDSAGASYYQIRQGHISGDALAIHTLPREPRRLAGIATVVKRRGVLDHVAARYAFPGTHNGARLVAAEYKLVTGGGFYERTRDYAEIMRDAIAHQAAESAACDFSTSYDYGSKINAFAKSFAVCRSGDIAPEPGNSLEAIKSLFDRYLGYYCDLFVDDHAKRPNAIFSRDLSFVILGLVTMYRATNSEDYLRRLATLCELLLEFELAFDDIDGRRAAGFLMRLDSPRASYVDCHSAALLALTQASRFIPDPRLPAAIERGMASYGLHTCAVDIGRPYKIDTVSTLMVDGHGNRAIENAFWNFKAGMTLRFFAALRSSPQPELQAIVARHNERMELFEFILRRQLEKSVTWHGDSVEIRTAMPANETNSETQPWVMLGLFGHPWD